MKFQLVILVLLKFVVNAFKVSNAVVHFNPYSNPRQLYKYLKSSNGKYFEVKILFSLQYLF